MNYKIVEADNIYPDVLLYRGYDENYNPTVVIYAIGNESENKENKQEITVVEIVEFVEVSTAISFIKNFDEKSANEWCKTKNIYY